MTQVADQLDAQALLLRSMAAGLAQSGLPIDVPWPASDGGKRTLHRLSSVDLLADAEAFEADAAKLRLLYT